MQITRAMYLFVGENEQNGFTEFVFGQHSHEFFSGFTDTLSIVRIDNKDQALKVK